MFISDLKYPVFFSWLGISLLTMENSALDKSMGSFQVISAMFLSHFQDQLLQSSIGLLQDRLDVVVLTPNFQEQERTFPHQWL